MKNKIAMLMMLCLISLVGYAEEFNAAIYVDQATGIAGTAYNYKTIEKAAASALQICKKKSGKKSCTSTMQWANGCGAAAWSPKNRSSRGAISETSIKLAEQNALERCKQIEGDAGCKVVASQCTNWETYETITVW